MSSFSHADDKLKRKRFESQNRLNMENWKNAKQQKNTSDDKLPRMSYHKFDYSRSYKYRNHKFT